MRDQLYGNRRLKATELRAWLRLSEAMRRHLEKATEILFDPAQSLMLDRAVIAEERLRGLLREAEGRDRAAA